MGEGMLWRALGLTLLLAATDASAGSSALSGDEIKQTVAGAVFEVDAPLGAKLPIYYTEDGRMSGDAGTLASYLGSASDSGSWWVSANRLCQKWRRWFDGAVHCLRLSQEGTQIFWRRDDGESGSATIVRRLERPAAEPEGRRQQEARADKAPAVAEVMVSPKPARPGQSELADEVLVAPLPAKPPLAKADADARVALRMAEEPVKPAASVRASAVPRPQAASRAQLSFRVAGVDLDDVLNVRNGPSAEHDVIGSILPDAAGIKVVGPCVSAWCPIQHRGVVGWVNSAYLIETRR
jgi:Bacterial SH3 domain